MPDILKSIIVWLVGIVYIILFFPLTFAVWLLTLPFDRERRITHWMLIWQSVMLTWLMPIWKISI